MHGMTISEMKAEQEKERKLFKRKALAGTLEFGSWRYNPNTSTLDFDPKVYPYQVDLKRCNDSFHILNTLTQLLHKSWCSKEQVGYLLEAIDQLSGGIQGIVLPKEKDKSFDMDEHLKSVGIARHSKLLKVEQVASILNISKLSVYRMIKDSKIKVVRIPLGKSGEIRISEEELNKILGNNSANEGHN